MGHLCHSKLLKKQRILFFLRPPTSPKRFTFFTKHGMGTFVAIFSYICQLCIFSTCLFQFFYFLSKFLHIICWLSVGDEHGYQSSSCTRQLGDQNWILAIFFIFFRSLPVSFQGFSRFMGLVSQFFFTFS